MHIKLKKYSILPYNPLLDGYNKSQKEVKKFYV